VVGTGTVLADDPALTARHPDGTHHDHQPVRVVVGHRDVPRGYAMAGPDVLHLRTHSPDAVLAALHARGLVDVLLEGGPRLAGAFVAAHRIDRVLAYLAPALLGAGPAALGDAGVVSMDGIARLQVDEVRRVGPDIVVDARPAYAGTADGSVAPGLAARSDRQARTAARTALRGGTS
jgi:diaminohydroxyphosphoribosylaminopyrimidine deaminase/5-amino-6-(5-phosphoribosylamino)uracil reductase